MSEFQFDEQVTVQWPQTVDETLRGQLHRIVEAVCPIPQVEEYLLK